MSLLKIKKIKIFAISLLSVCYIQTKASDTTNWRINCGVGMYEAFSAGVKYNYKPNLGVSVSMGSQFRTYKNQKYILAVISHDWTFRNRDKTLTSWSFNQKLLFWHMEDPWYKWTVLSMEPAIEKAWKLSSKIAIKVDAGPVFMVVLGFKRKTFSEVGWPRYFNVNVNAKLVYDL